MPPPSEQTNLAPPPVVAPSLVAGAFRRDALLDRLMGTDDRIVVLTAPSGYGKSTTLSLWQGEEERPFAWVSLRPSDDDPVSLVQHIGAAVHGTFPFSVGLLEVLAAKGVDVDTDVLPQLTNEMSLCRPFVLVLDDIQLVQSQAALRCLQAMVTGIPDGFTVVLSGRVAPRLHLARQRLEVGVLELSATDLAMDATEAAKLCAAQDLHLDDVSLDFLVDAVEGWPAGLRLASNLLSDARERADGPSLDPSHGSRWASDDLVSEFLDNLPVADVEFMQRSSVLERMSGQLLDELLEVEHANGTSSTQLRRLAEQGTGFLVCLDDSNEYYRYHQLFSEALRRRLVESDPVESRRLHRRASQLLESRGDMDGSVRQAHLGDDPQRVADLALLNAVPMALGGRSAQLQAWLDLLDADQLAAYPAASLSLAWSALVVGDEHTVARGIELAERAPHVGPLVDGTPSVQVAVAALKATIGIGGVHGVIANCDIVRSGGGRESNPWWGVATLLQGTALEMLGEFDRARQRLNESLPEVLYLPTYEAGAQGHLALLALYSGDLVEAERRSSRALELIEQHHLEAVIPMVPMLAGGALLASMTGRAEDMRRYSILASRLIARMDPLSPRTALLGHVLLARAALAAGLFEQASNHASEAELVRKIDDSPTEVCEQLDRLLGQLAEQRATIAPGTPALTSAELRVLAYLPTHHSRQEIADQLHISQHTVKSHTVSIYRKLNVSSRNDAVEVARRLGLLQSLTIQNS